ncbi:hypothetical protein SKAU_G00373810 [Synaphobranchus kaupii]|uniref:Uncharacterized protein n=1 Tax=Synaphobranchus kaupii TaxID=118154 RepID=A0A9Q1IF98_SYNKA|nr:hypothetical protein SKAU_G00373810 [Synaphobranchus kaupii]
MMYRYWAAIINHRGDGPDAQLGGGPRPDDPCQVTAEMDFGDTDSDNKRNAFSKGLLHSQRKLANKNTWKIQQKTYSGMDSCSASLRRTRPPILT